MRPTTTINELVDQDIIPTGSSFAGLEIWKRGEERYLLERDTEQVGVMHYKISYNTQDKIEELD